MVLGGVFFLEFEVGVFGVADIYLSDVHLRLDRPGRGRRLARLVDGLGPDDRVVVVGDLCDFWFASRQAGRGGDCQGLRALAEFRRRGGDLRLLPGNHDGVLGSFYQETLGVSFAGDALDLQADGLRVHLVHGHRLGARKAWKGLLEGRAFARAFQTLPRAVARGMERRLEQSNDRDLAGTERHHHDAYRRYARSRAGEFDLMVFGHIHTPADDRSEAPRVVVLGGWHSRTSYMRVEGGTATLVVEAAPPR